MRLSPAESLRFCGRSFSSEELEWIRGLLASQTLNRSQLARRVCQQLNWVNRAGQLKEMSSRVALLRMERAGLLRLPAPTHRNSNGQAVGGQLKIERPEGLSIQPVDRLVPQPAGATA